MDPTNTVYALKMLKKTEVLRLNQVEHIKSERSILEEITHPFLVTL
jgi:serine/threonine protein kinase